jgi:hypothetical protein
VSTQATIIADSISIAGKRITTFLLTYPRYIHPEMLTHRAFSKNASSSRAVPVSKLLRQVISDPVIPIHFGANQAGMSAKEELKGWMRWLASSLWLGARWPAVGFVWALNKLGLHKQITNRLLEPWLYITVILTGTEFDNFYWLRCDKEHAHPDIYDLAEKMLAAQNNNAPKITEVHLPFIKDDEWNQYDADTLIKLSVARCCRVSYLNHDKTEPNLQKDLTLHDSLLKAGHMSPFEHQAAAQTDEICGNFVGWRQYRKLLAGENRTNYPRLKRAT